MPAREDLIWEEELDVTGFSQMRDFIRNVRLIARPIPENSMEYISVVGEIFLSEIKLYRIGTSEPAVKYEIIEKPNNWTKKAPARTGASQGSY